MNRKLSYFNKLISLNNQIIMKVVLKSIALAFIVLNFNCKQVAEDKVEVKPIIEEIKQQPEISSEMSKAIIDHHLEAFLANDLEGLVSDYTEESIVITPDTTVVGLEGIRGLFKGLLAAFPTEGTTIELDEMVIKNELVYVIWHGKSPTVEVPFGTDTFIIKENKILQQTFAGIINSIE